MGERQVVKDAGELVVGETQELARLGVELTLDVISAARERGEQRVAHRCGGEGRSRSLSAAAARARGVVGEKLR